MTRPSPVGVLLALGACALGCAPSTGTQSAGASPNGDVDGEVSQVDVPDGNNLDSSGDNNLAASADAGVDSGANDSVVTGEGVSDAVSADSERDPCAGTCKIWGHCDLPTDNTPASWSFSCVALTDAGCLASDVCATELRCKASRGTCVISSTTGCDDYGCEKYGLCSAMQGECVAATEADCLQSYDCKYGGKCYPLLLTAVCNPKTLICKGQPLVGCTQPPEK